jgi:hypothetical protein
LRRKELVLKFQLVHDIADDAREQFPPDYREEFVVIFPKIHGIVLSGVSTFRPSRLSKNIIFFEPAGSAQ